MKKAVFIKLIPKLRAQEMFGVAEEQGAHRLSDWGCTCLWWGPRDHKGGRRRAGTTGLHPPRPRQAGHSHPEPQPGSAPLFPAAGGRAAPAAPSGAGPAAPPARGQRLPGQRGRRPPGSAPPGWAGLRITAALLIFMLFSFLRRQHYKSPGQRNQRAWETIHSEAPWLQCSQISRCLNS